MKLDIIIPVHNEAEHLAASVEAFIAAATPRLPGVLNEIILVENGSNDGTSAVCEALAAKYPGTLRVLTLGRGSYGEAIRYGMMESRGSHLTILECDCLDVEFVVRCADALGAGRTDFVLAAKPHPDSSDRRPFKRRALTRLYNWIIRTATGYPGADTHGLKSIEAGVAKRLCRLAITTDEVFQTEIVLIAWRLGLRIREVWIDIAETRPTPVNIRQRLPKVLTTVRELRASLQRPEANPPRAMRPVVWRSVFPQPERAPLAQWVWILAVGVVVFALAMYWRADHGRDYVTDEGIYTYVGWAWSQGDWPYRDAWDHKGPVTYLVTMLRTGLFGTAPGFLVIQEMVLGLATAVFAAGTATLLWGGSGGAVALCASVLLWTQRSPDFGHMSTVGSAIGLCTMASIFFAIAANRAGRLRGLACGAFGLAAGLSFCTKPNALNGLFLGALIVLVHQPKPTVRTLGRSLTWALAGFVIPLAAFGITFGLVGALHPMLDAVFGFNKVRGALLVQDSGLLKLSVRSAKVLWSIGALPVYLGAVAVGMAMLLRRSWVRDRWELVLQPVEYVIPIGLLAEGVLLISNGAYVHHAYPLLPVLALGAAWIFTLAWRARTNNARIWGVVALVLMLGPPLARIARLPKGDRSTAPPMVNVASLLDSLTTPDERILAFTDWNSPGMLSLAHRLAAVRYEYPVGLYTKRYASDARWTEVLNTFSGPHPVRFVVVTTSNLARPTSEVTLDLLLGRLDHPLILPALRDTTSFPARERVKTALAQHYQLSSCVADLCLLRRIE